MSVSIVRLGLPRRYGSGLPSNEHRPCAIRDCHREHLVDAVCRLSGLLLSST